MCTWYVWKKYLVGGSFLLKDILIGHFRIQDLWNWVLLTSYCYPCWRENRTKSELKSEAQLKTLFQDRFHLSFLKKPQFFTLNLTKICRLSSRFNKFSLVVFFFNFIFFRVWPCDLRALEMCFSGPAWKRNCHLRNFFNGDVRVFC